MSGQPQKFYGVAEGRDKGVFDNWDSAKAATDKHPGNIHQGFRDPAEAREFVDRGGAYSKQDWAEARGGDSSNGYKPKK